jgi:hypothetical protein
MKRRWIALLFFAFLVLLLGGTYTVLRYTGASRTFVEQALARFIRGDFRLADADVDPTTGRVTLRGFRIAHPDRDGRPLLEAGNVELDLSTNPLREVGSLRQVRIRNLEVNLDLTAGGKIDLRRILELPEVQRIEEQRAGTFPAIWITDSKITLQVVEGAPPVEFEQVELELVPEAADGRHVVLTGSTVSRAGHRITISGSGDLRRGEFRALLEARDIELAPEIANAYSPALRRYLDDAHLSGRARKASLWIEYPARRSDGTSGVGGGIGLEVDAIACELPDLPYPIRGAAGKVSASTRNDGTIKFELASRGADGDLTARGVLTECLAGRPRVDLQFTGDGILITEQLARAVASKAAALRVWDAFVPSAGRVDADVRLRDVPGADAPELSMDLTLRGATAAFVGFRNPRGPSLAFPYELRDLRGTVHVRPRGLILRDITGIRDDGGRFHIGGEIRGAPGPDQEIELRIEGREAAFSAELRAALQALDPEFAAHYERYSPEGRADVDVEVRKPPHRPTEVAVAIRPLAASATFAGFPYRVEQIHGRVTIGNDGVSLALIGQRQGATVHIDGRFRAEGDGDGLRSELWIKGERVPLDNELRGALATLAPATDEQWEMISPRGEANCEVTLWRDASDSDFTYDVRIELRDCQALLARFRMPIERLQGNLFVHGTGSTNRVDLTMLRGEIANDTGTPPARLLIQGRILIDGDEQEQDVTAVIHGLQLNDRLSVALDHCGALRRSAWDVLRPAGLVGVVLRQRQDRGDAEPDQFLRVQLRDVSSNALMLPAPATRMNGEVRVHNNSAEFDDIRGMVGESPVICTNGSIYQTPGASIVKATITAESFPVDDRLANLMTGPLREAYLARTVRGAVKITDLKMTYHFPEQPENFRVDFSGQLVAKDISLRLAALVEEVNGIWNIDAARVTPQGGDIAGSTLGVGFTVLGHRARDLSATFAADPVQVAFRAIDLRLHDGNVRSEPPDRDGLVYRFEPPGELEMHVSWEGMSLRDFMRASGQHTSALWGTLGGQLDLHRLRGNDLVEMEADAQIRIGGGRLGPVPLFSTIYAYLEPDKRPQFNSARLDLHVADRRIELADLQLASSLVTVKGQGSVTMDGYLDMVLFFPDLFGNTPDWLLLPRVLSFLTDSVVRFHVFGYLRAPRARPRWLWQGTPSRRNIEPIPARR